MHRNKLRFQASANHLERFRCASAKGPEVVVAISGQKLHLFQMDWGIDKIARRNANCGNKRLFGLTYH
jgi:hypothetical protein